MNSLAEKAQLPNFAPEKSNAPVSAPTAATAVMAKAIQMESQSSFRQRSEILNDPATTTSLSFRLDIGCLLFVQGGENAPLE